MASLLYAMALQVIIGTCLTSAHLARTVTATEACHSLAQSLGSKTQSSGAQYNASAKGAWSLFNQLDGETSCTSVCCVMAYWMYIGPEPTCIVFPRDTSDVVVAMKTIYEANSHYAVRGGGHSGMPGWNT